ncbi:MULTISPECIES: dethiobiotin synthase [unclassified Rhizobium]|jgi:dethiobiotin synthetase|uniref:dethiobiotin synthase n=1 Tax=unclassified Rhizobium TaxID=2613769 RepID=UPI000645B274|nr:MULTISPECIES: dethiobiotin synthase [unclassified Rhizobium]MBN8954359.1 ATP-dependent dethiobiotin synthetase BioD [Rhizobium tropici]OJY79119.1 MAG: dethiobiotin synthase [Rhizobium sp. 60-20]RKD67860.1 dethiobiotin synthetase [Rhizobium sp. WW_1]
MTARFVVTGTDTGIGKTVFAAALTGALNARYWKPVQSGLEGDTDSDTVARLSGLPAEYILPEAYRLSTPVSPHLSARLDGVEIDPVRLEPPAGRGPLVIEGAGGLLVPLGKDAVFADVFARWRIPVILCARTSLGTINHTLLSIEALRSRNIPICGVAFIGAENADTQATIAAIGQVKVLGRLPLLEELTSETLRRDFGENFDIASLIEAHA